jgi:hypothetical protein
MHAANDGSFGRSAGIQVGRAVALIAGAVLVGVLFLRHNGGSGATTVGVGHTTTTSPPARSSTTTTPQTSSSAALRAPANVKVVVANGTVASGGGSTHLAGTVSTTIKAQGYDTLAAVNATQGVTASIVYFQPGFQREAAVLAQALSLPASAVQAMPATPPVANLGGANLLVVAGPDLAKTTSSTTPPTTAHISATTTTVHR